MFSAEAEQGSLRLLVSAPNVNKCPFWGLFSATLFTFLCLLINFFFMFKIVPSTVLKCSLVFLSSRLQFAVKIQ